MNDIPIVRWTSLPSVDWNSLLVGNGASIALHSGFDYGSLHTVASTNLPTTGALFSKLGTTDFEHVLLACWYAELVNAALEAPAPRITRAYKEVRTALINAVRAVHPPHAAITSPLEHVGSWASKFKTVVTLNYDVTLYWAMQLFNSSHGTWFKDCFLSGAFDPDWPRLRDFYGDAEGATLVFYAHGNLVLARDIYGAEGKLSAAGSGPQPDLLSTICEQWRAQSHVPIFVSEGVSSAKLAAISRSAYLSEVYNHVLNDLGDNVVVYGFAFDANDQHILDAIKKSAPRRIAVSVYTGQSVPAQQSYCHGVRARTSEHLPSTEVMFFDSGSPSCWNNP